MDSFKVLGQIQPLSNILSVLYTVPVSTQTVVSTFSACNTSNTSTYFSFSVAPAGAVDNINQYLLYQILIEANNTYMATVGLSLAATDVLRVYSVDGYVSFSAFGTEIT